MQTTFSAITYTVCLLLHGWLREQTRWSKSCVLIGYPSGHYGPILDCPLDPAKAKFFGVTFWPYNKSFIDQACLVKKAGYWLRSFLRFYGPLGGGGGLSRSIKKQQKRTWPISSHLDRTSLVNNAYILHHQISFQIIIFHNYLSCPWEVQRLSSLYNETKNIRWVFCVCNATWSVVGRPLRVYFLALCVSIGRQWTFNLSK